MEPDTTNTGMRDDATALVDRLVASSVVTLDDTESDLTLTESFRSNWRQRIEHLRGRDHTEFLGLLLDTDPDVLVVDEDADESTVTVTNESTTIGTWPSDGALIADVAAFITLGEHVPGWDDLSGAERDELTARLRVFLEACPICDGSVQVTVQSVDGHDRPTVTCEACESILLE